MIKQELVFFYTLSILLLSSCTTNLIQQSPLTYLELKANSSLTTDSSASFIKINGLVTIDTFYVYYNNHVNPEKIGTEHIVQTKSDLYFFSTNKYHPISFIKKPIDFKYHIFDKESVVIVSSMGFFRNCVFPFIQDDSLRKYLSPIVQKQRDLPLGVSLSKRFYLKNNQYFGEIVRYYPKYKRYCCDVVKHKTNLFLKVQIPVWYFNYYLAQYRNPPIYYFLREEIYYDFMLNVLIPLPQN